MLRKRRNRRQDQALVSVYLRSDAYYVARANQTTTGLWTLSGETATTLSTDATAVELGEALLANLGPPAEVIAHPKQDEWVEHRKRSLGPILSQARVRSWRAFESGSTHVQAARKGEEFSLTPMQRMHWRPDAWEPDVARELNLHAPDAIEIGAAVQSLIR